MTKPIEKLTGIRHFFAAASYSFGGAKRLLGEAAFRHELGAVAVAMIAAGLGRQASPKDVGITLDPVIADRRLDSALGPIAPGAVCGMRNTASWSGKGLTIELDLTMAVGTEDAQDRVELSGPVPLMLTIPGSTPGDTATVAAMVNCARLLPIVPPGLKTMLDMPPASAR